MRVKRCIMDKGGMRRALTRIAYEIIEKNKGGRDLVLVGIKKRGVPLAERISRKIAEIEGVDLFVGSLDITPFRDDLSSHKDIYDAISFSFEVGGQRVVLVDDVLYTGRTVRAAMEALVHSGRPLMVQLAVLIDRGHRELPIRADYVGKNVPTNRREVIQVKMEETDELDEVQICEP